jgi:ribose transport system ATP-binding protein
VAQSNVCLDVTRVHGRYLRDVSFRVRRGEILGFAGLDGSGRDELALALGGAAEADVDLRTEAGAISGRSSVVQTRAAGIGLVLPNTHPGAMVAEFTVRENLCLPNASSMSRRGLISERGERKAARRWLEELDIRPRESEKLLREFSGGNRQKVALAKVLQQNPSVLVLNDPTSGVDVGARRSIYDVIEQRASLGVGIVVCSSDIEDLVSVCDRVLCLVAGAIVDELTGEQLTEHAVLNRIVSDGSESGRSAKPDVAPRHRSGDDAVASWRSIA